MEEFLVQWDPEDCTLQEAQIQQAQGFVITSITNLDARVPTPLIQAVTATKRPRGKPKKSERLPLDTKCRVQFAPLPQGPTHIRTIRGEEAALDAFLHTETTRPLTPLIGQSEPPGPTPTTRAHRVKAPPRTRRSRTPPPQPPTQRHNPPFSLAKPPRRTHIDLLQIIMEEGEPDRDSIPREGPYVYLVPPTFPWNTLETYMIGVHNSNGAATSLTLISPQRYARDLRRTRLQAQRHPSWWSWCFPSGRIPHGTPQRYETTTTWKHSSRFRPDTCNLSRLTNN